MIEKKTGTVVNVSSIQGSIASNLMVVYGASKAFVNHFTEYMQAECGHNGVTFTSHLPMYVVSNMSKIRKSSLTVPMPDEYAKAAVKHFGLTEEIRPYWSHAPYAAV